MYLSIYLSAELLAYLLTHLFIQAYLSSFPLTTTRVVHFRKHLTTPHTLLCTAELTSCSGHQYFTRPPQQVGLQAYQLQHSTLFISRFPQLTEMKLLEIWSVWLNTRHWSPHIEHICYRHFSVHVSMANQILHCRKVTINSCIFRGDRITNVYR